MNKSKTFLIFSFSKNKNWIPKKTCFLNLEKMKMKNIFLNQRDLYLLLGNPSEYLFVRHEPTASITALDVKF